MADSLHTAAECVGIAKRPWPERVADMSQVTGRGPSRLLRDTLYPGFVADDCRQVATTVARTMATVHAARLALAAERYGLVHHGIADTLAMMDIDPARSQYLDPFTGAPLLFRKTETGFTIYSVGQNLRDDGGEVIGTARAAGERAQGRPDIGVTVSLP